jgi:predicted DNA-binding transcriptional regulator AlpA
MTVPIEQSAEAHYLGGGQLLTEEEVARRLRVTTRTLLRWRNTGDGPEFVRIGPRMLRYSEGAITAWTTRNTYAHRAAEAVAA